ncbi:hypothetical protein [Streptomyces barkulensis]|uniref:hypothetical protein n=1 Tax=Streptomyces barkulensis TaxID=1257026 RepID=UPI001F0D07BF|nr:hypothetical protein [Streptomyces barkulensis]
MIESLTVLAADAQTQAAWLAKCGVMTDEIALDFDHAFGMAGSLMLAGCLTRRVVAGLQEVDATLNAMSSEGNADRWTRDALSTDEGWALARRLARQVLVVEVGEWQRPLPGITVVR